MPYVSVVTTKRRFLASLRSADRLFAAVLPFMPYTGSTIRATIHPKNARRITGLAFLSMVAAWEDYVEDLLVRYVTGAVYPNGSRPPLAVAPASSLLSAYRALTGKATYNPAQHYLSLTSWASIVAMASPYLTSGRPFSSVSSQQESRLGDAVVIRNKVAHRSDKATTAFKVVARSHLGLPSGARLTQSFDVGSLLISPATYGFPAGSTTYFDAYSTLFRQLAQILSP